jgi:thiol-disulfide isomerase/thioredoxin
VKRFAHAFAWLAMASCGAHAADAPRPSAATATQRVQPVSVAEFRRALEQQRGHVVVLNLWASWCVPCLKEIPELQKLERAFASCGVRVVGLATDDPAEVTGAVAAMHAKYFPAFRSYARTEGEPDSYAGVVDPAWNELMPTTYVLDAQGRTVRRLQGGKHYDEFAAVVSDVAGCRPKG